MMNHRATTSREWGWLIVVDATPLRYVAYYKQPDLSGFALLA